jgi:2-keto-3-deoxy-L-fuconate dehydrogenase
MANSANGFRLDGKAAAVTGAGSGIGRAIALRFARAGAVIHALDIDATSAAVSAEEIREAGGKATPHACDVGDQAQTREVFEKIARLGTLSILANNAGISNIGRLENTSEADFDRVYRVNVKGIYNCMLAAIDLLIANGGGAIVNMASIAGTVGLADRFAYSMSKGAVIAMTYSVAKDYLPFKIRCNCISPARVHTPFVDDYLAKNYPGREQEMFDKLSATAPMGRMGKPREVADLALFLCSEEAAFITGSNYPIDGGFLNLHG